MKERTISLVVIGLLATVSLMYFFKGRSAIRQAEDQARVLQRQVDSLRDISSEYSQLKDRYTLLYENLSQTRGQLAALKVRITDLSSSEIAGVKEIRTELTDLLASYDSLNLTLPLTTGRDIDSLLFP